MGEALLRAADEVFVIESCGLGICARCVGIFQSITNYCEFGVNDLHLSDLLNGSTLSI